MGEQPGWQLSGSGPEAYEKYIVVAFMGKWAQDLVEVVDIQADQRVLDVGCGTGVVTRAVAQRLGPHGKIVGFDVNDVMLQMAQQFAQQADLDAIEWQQGDAASMPFGTAEYDVVLCEQGLQYFPDRAGALREMARVMVPGGQLALSVWRSLERHPFFIALVDALASHLGEDSTSALRAAFSLTEREELRALVSAAGFRDVHVRLEVQMSRYPSIEDFVRGYVVATPMAGEIAAMAEADQTRMFQDVVEALRDYRDDGGLAAPMECHVVTARK
jgi:ubiquinone/menaquinone biosynthesis C-methylase UbiE